MSHHAPQQRICKFHLGSSRVGLLRRIVPETMNPQCIGNAFGVWAITETMPDTFQEQRGAEFITQEPIKTQQTYYIWRCSVDDDCAIFCIKPKSMIEAVVSKGCINVFKMRACMGTTAPPTTDGVARPVNVISISKTMPRWSRRNDFGWVFVKPLKKQRT